MSDRYIFDTNFVSELRRQRPDPRIVAFHDGVADEAMFVSAMTIGELRRGAELKYRKDPAGGQNLSRWIEQIEVSFEQRILPVDRDVADLWGRLMATRPRPVVDTLIAATAIVHEMTLVTRNVADVKDTGVRLLDPWNAG